MQGHPEALPSTATAHRRTTGKEWRSTDTMDRAARTRDSIRSRARESALGHPLMTVYHRLRAQHGPQRWWEGSGTFEIAVGAVLTQRVAWRNAERAVSALNARGWLSPERLAEAPVERVAEAIRPALFYNQKAHRLKGLASLVVQRYAGDLDRLLRTEVDRQRATLLSLAGIGPETADAIILYAGGSLSFVIDAYARRVLRRLGVIAGDEAYDLLRSTFMAHLPADVSLYQEYHALFVAHGRTVCRRTAPECRSCALFDLCAHALAGTDTTELNPMPA